MNDSMELKDFISQTLVQITEGVKEAQEKVHELDGDVNPPRDETMAPETVDFEVSVTTVQERGGGGGLKVGIAGFGVQGEGTKSSKDSSVGTIKFSVPLHLPLGKSPRPKGFEPETRTKSTPGGGALASTY